MKSLIFVLMIQSKDEVFDIFRNIASNGARTCRFSSIKRQNTSRVSTKTYNKICLMESTTPIKIYPASMVDHIKFFVDKPIIFCGIGFYGKTISLDDECVKMRLYDGNIKIQEIGSVTKHDGTPKTYQLLFTKEVLLKPHIQYMLDIRKHMPLSFGKVGEARYKGGNYLSEIKMNDISLKLINTSGEKFINSFYCKNAN